MSKHRHKEECCYPMVAPTCGMGGYSGHGSGASGIRWIYALLILIIIVLQFGRRNKGGLLSQGDGCGCSGEAVAAKGDDQLIDNSVLFIIIVFLLVLCAGCWGGSNKYGYGGGYGF
ncbi:hypothetical protein OXPF_07080 [Oxobacter pfennigii]|uniref:Uncharacterized protein n=1 Tax=Oxobacter pfennigii TaxID=36849 RepID=A0A0P8WSB4_9CLOT|nr:hypothetical protein [Oxobacter pfennigii]KPU45475.1 hypothetical protein OXPF_07080 [Oxobacter pfennigii]